jgi:hypothetical protein
MSDGVIGSDSGPSPAGCEHGAQAATDAVVERVDVDFNLVRRAGRLIVVVNS